MILTVWMLMKARKVGRVQETGKTTEIQWEDASYWLYIVHTL